MKVGDPRELGAWLSREVPKRAAASSLQPFGDAPFESELAAELQRMVASQDSSVLREAMEGAIQHAIAEVLGDDPPPSAFSRLASLALVARYLRIGLDGWGTLETLSFLRKQARRYPVAAETVAMLIRSVSRSDGRIDNELLEEWSVTEPLIVRRAAIEALSRQASDRLVELLEILLRASTHNSQLIWTLSHLDTASLSIARQVGVRDLTYLMSEFRSGLSEIDSSGEAYAQWLRSISVPPQLPPRFEVWDWRLDDSKPKVLEAA